MFGTGPLTSLAENRETLHASLLADDFDGTINGNAPIPQRTTSSVVEASRGRPSADDTYVRLKGLLDSLFRLQVYLTIIIIAAVILFTLNGLANLDYLTVWPDPGGDLNVEQYQLVFGLSNWIHWLALALIVWYSWYSDTETPFNSQVFSRGANKEPPLASIPIPAVSTGITSMDSPGMPSHSPSVETTYLGSVPQQLSLDQSTSERSTLDMDSSQNSSQKRSLRTTSNGRPLGGVDALSPQVGSLASPTVDNMGFTARQNSANHKAQLVARDLARDLGLQAQSWGKEENEGHNHDDDDEVVPIDEEDMVPELNFQVTAPPPRVSQVDYEDDRFG